MNESKFKIKLTELRNLKGITQEEVAAALEISNKTISKWENGTSLPDLNMLIRLSDYYNVSTDTLLGLENKEKNTERVIADKFHGLTRNETVLKMFEIIMAIFPASHDENALTIRDDKKDIEVIPESNDRYTRNQISVKEIFNFAVCSDEVNLAVMQLQNKSNFSWLKDDEKIDTITTLFKYLSDKNNIKICAFIHSTACSDNFTTDYISKKVGIDINTVQKVIDESCKIGLCSEMKANTTKGEVKVYHSIGDGMILSIISLAYERMFGKKYYDYNYNYSNKLIRGDENEIITKY